MLREVLEKIILAGGSPPAVEVAKLAGLGPADLDEVRAVWSKIPVGTREAVLRVAVQLAENDVELDFEALFKLGLTDTEAVIRAVAIEGLWEDEDFRTADQLARMLREDPAENVRVAAALGLARFALMAELGTLYEPSAERVRAALVAVATDPADTIEVRRRAIEALGAISAPFVADLISAAYDDPNPKSRASALYAMGRSCDERWLSTIVRELENENAEIRYEAARAAGELENTQAVVPLITLLDDPDLEVRLAVIGALGSIGGNVARQALLRCAQNENSAIHAAALAALDEVNISDDPLSISPFLKDSTRTI